jgi:hypothetical protein
MDKMQKEKVESALIDFIIRTAQNDKAAPEAVAVLPNVVSSLIELERSIHLC